MRGSPRGVAMAVGLAAVLVAGIAVAAPTELGRVTATAGIVVNRASGDVIWQREPDLPLPPASTTKVLTALVALQSARLHDALIVSPTAATVSPSKLYLRAGWQLRLNDLVHALLLTSANDAAEVIAEGVAGSVEVFAERMNQAAREAGATHSFFVNPHGLPADGHLSTARDLTTIFDAALRNPQFREIVLTRRTVIQPLAGGHRQITLHNHNRLLDHFRVPVVGKTGWTIAAKKCFVGAALTGDNNELLVAVLGSRDLWGDLTRLLTYGLATDRAPEPVVQMAQSDDPVSREGAALAAGDSDDDERPLAHRHHAGARGRAFTLQLASFSRAPNAERLRASLAQKGYPAAIRRSSAAKNAKYQVVMEGFSSPEAARVAAQKLRHTHPDLRPIVVAQGT